MPPGGKQKARVFAGSFLVGEDGLEPPTPCL